MTFPNSSRRLAWLAVTAPSLLCACATGGWAARDLHPGDSRDQVLRVMGPPTASYAMPGGRERLEYNHMPAGRQTWMVDLDAAGRVAGAEQVLDERHFAAVLPGMGRDDVLRLIGPPSETASYERPEPGITWIYRFETVERCTVFRVAFDRATGKVLAGDYPPDPRCDFMRG